jgi:ABC-type nitrate/sulfonate/bicarbonate transport system substrate-binding protein
MKQMRIIVTPFMCLVLVFLALSVERGFADPAKKIKLVFMTPWSPSVHWAPFWSAQRRYWPEENIEADVRDGRGGSGVVKAVAAGSAPVGYVPSDALKAIQKGLPIKIIAAGSQTDGSMIYTLKRPDITTLKDLEGKTIGQYAFSATLAPLAKLLLKREGVNLDKVKFVNIRPGEDPKLLIAGNIDAGEGKFGTQNLRLYCQGYDTTVFRFLNYGLDFYDYFIIVNTNWAQEVGYDGVVRLLRGVAKGYVLRKTNFAQSVDDMNYYREMRKHLTKQSLAEAKGTLPRMMGPDIDKYGWGVITEEKMKREQDILFDIGFLDKKIDVKKYYDDRYLKDPSVHKIAMEFAEAPVDAKADAYLKGCRKK